MHNTCTNGRSDHRDKEFSYISVRTERVEISSGETFSKSVWKMNFKVSWEDPKRREKK